MQQEDISNKVTNAIHEIINQHANHSIGERLSAASVAVGMASALRIGELITEQDFSALVLEIINTVEVTPSLSTH
ncbi:hypothetical protein [Pseudomonas sp. PDM13]|uniref:hypothetical protein n=1 Tax=Pseudomonas sp. PDM13 TaxID=2769255 RepID=UPI0021DFA14E|nr:hypothetical protein [Pseudomonas sp. PDM13]MCU9949869.1 hypothetical protein [Pseudomonas sp. PDM13]